ncbi:MAG: ABC transporter permease, partial [Erysipelotrichaceae bacterium]|nr:ABC transporter permease [Erysipelotrichaceae bacterium]
MSEDKEKKVNDENSEQYDLNDDRRVKVLSPGALVAKRFFRNRMAVVGLVTLVAMFVFSFVGGLVSPYKQDQLFYRNDMQSKEYAVVKENTDFRYLAADGQDFGSALQAQAFLAISKNTETFSYRNATYAVTREGDDFYSISQNGTTVGIAFKDIVSEAEKGVAVKYNDQFAILKAYTSQETEIEYEGSKYTIDEDGGVFKDGKSFAYVSPYIVNANMSDIFLSREFKEQLIEAVTEGGKEFNFKDADGVEYNYELKYNPANKMWSVMQEKATRVYDTYSPPSKSHWLGTDKNGMDMLTRLMYGGRVSLLIGFLVEAISTVLGVIMGGISGYFGKWVDNLIMRIVDIFYCIPSMPLIIILGAAMDAMRVNPTVRMIYLMLILGFLGWPGIARMVRGQILSLREQEFMTAAEATGLSVSRRIFKHLVPNVIPQLIVSVTMGLGGTIITEATLSFLGLGVKFPFASWGNIINDVNDTYVLTNYWF